MKSSLQSQANLKIQIINCFFPSALRLTPISVSLTVIMMEEEEEKLLDDEEDPKGKSQPPGQEKLVDWQIALLAVVVIASGAANDVSGSTNSIFVCSQNEEKSQRSRWEITPF